MLLAFDTEASGLPNKRQPPEHESQPHLVQLGCILSERDGTERGRVSLIVRPPEGISIPKGASDVHGITDEIAARVGVPLRVAVAIFSNLCRLATHGIAHNEEFDRLIMNAAIHRVGAPREPFAALVPVCTVQLSGPILNLPPTDRMKAAGFTKWKAPNLGEAYRFFFNEELKGAHDALVDVDACRRIFFELVRRGAVPGFAASSLGGGGADSSIVGNNATARESSGAAA